MSVELELEHRPQRLTHRPIAEIARSVRIDPRISTLVPGFDAPFFQAGMAGYSDGAMRLVARRHGCPYCVTEALLDRILIANGARGNRREDPEVLARECGGGDPESNRLAGVDDHPIAGQLIGTDPDEMATGAALLVGMGYDVIDVNFACPVKKIKNANRGGHFLRAPDDAIAVLRAVRAAVPTSIPTTVKLRRGYSDDPELAHAFDEIFARAYELGYSWATVHCRTVEQKYAGPSRWEFLRELTSRYPDRIVFGSGDVWLVSDLFAMLELTGVHAVAVARGCIGNPWIFRQARDLMAGRAPRAPELSEQAQVLLAHLDFAVQLHGAYSASLQMRKFGTKFAQHHPSPAEARSAFLRCTSPEEWRAVIARLYTSAGDSDR